MKNVWLQRRVSRKAIVPGHMVFWDRNMFSASDYDLLRNMHGDEPFMVLSMPYMQLYFGMNHGPLVDIGRNGVKLTTTLMKNLIRV